ncbi:MAG: hypothetical protein ACLQMO_05555 [Acidobacteriaceae bacterium]
MDMPRHRHGPPWSSPVVPSQVIHVGGASIQIDMGPGSLDLTKVDALQSIETAAGAVFSPPGPTGVQDTPRKPLFFGCDLYHKSM